MDKFAKAVSLGIPKLLFYIALRKRKNKHALEDVGINTHYMYVTSHTHLEQF